MRRASPDVPAAYLVGRAPFLGLDFEVSRETLIPTTFNAFMNVEVAPSGEISIGPPLSTKPGDFVDLRAETDLVVGVTACSAEKSNNHALKPIDLMIFR